jgi:polyhydroxyalkanoate synthesis regulator phasin
MSDDRTLSELIEEMVDKGATTAEEIHRAIAELPLNVLERLDLFEQATSEVRKVQDTSIGAIYDLIRNVNHKVAQLSGELLERRQESAEDD